MSLVEIKSRRYFTCPNGCDHRFEVEHLLSRDFGGNAGPWYCDDCGDGWTITRHGSARLDVQPTGHKRIAQWTLLEIPPQSLPIRLKLKTHRYDGEAIDQHNQEYLYEEHTCLTNWLRDVETIAIGGDEDPHGLAKHVHTFETEEELDAEFHTRQRPPDPPEEVFVPFRVGSPEEIAKANSEAELKDGRFVIPVYGTLWRKL